MTFKKINLIFAVFNGKNKTHTQMKKFLAIFAIIATFGFVACNNAETTEENTDSLQTEATEEVIADTTPVSTDTTAADTTKKP